jgi:serine/threonine-protein kinase
MAGRSRFWHDPAPTAAVAPAGARRAAPSTQPASSLIDSSALPVETEGFTSSACAQSPHSELYEARVAGTDEPVALKVVRLARRRKPRALPARGHRRRPTATPGHRPHPGAGIVNQDGQPCGWLAMEWVPGSDLSRHAQPGRLLPEELVLRIGAVTAEALAHAHAQGGAPRPQTRQPAVQPGSRWRAEGGRLRLRPPAGPGQQPQRPDGGHALLHGARATQRRAAGWPLRLYALGVVLFELLTGQRPFDRSSMGETLAAIAGEARRPAGAASNCPRCWAMC